ncbi:MAG: hypothetical protein HY200_02190 [Nitrospirae bacterium]|nr:hypothetical protein [Nitrospirota bacterium]MBI3593746.1 hypothetical protein [Nitrospirota bacterium]
MNQTAFGQLFGVTQEAVSLWERGGCPDLAILLKIVQWGKTTVEWLVTGKNKKKEESILIKKRPSAIGTLLSGNRRKYRNVPLLYDHVSNGPPRKITDNNVADYFWLPPLLFRKNLFLIHMRDSSMEPILRKEDLVALFKWSDPIQILEGNIVGVWLPQGGLTIRWLASNKKQWILYSENRLAPPIFLEKKDTSQFFRVIWWWGVQTQD